MHRKNLYRRWNGKRFIERERRKKNCGDAEKRFKSCHNNANTIGAIHGCSSQGLGRVSLELQNTNFLDCSESKGAIDFCTRIFSVLFIQQIKSAKAYHFVLLVQFGFNASGTWSGQIKCFDFKKISFASKNKFIHIVDGPARERIV